MQPKFNFCSVNQIWLSRAMCLGPTRIGCGRFEQCWKEKESSYVSNGK